MNINIQATGKTVDVPEATFGRAFNGALVHQVVTSYLAGARQGTKAQKSRSEVSGGGRKPRPQKGSGRARAGTIRSPIWRGGGATFAARPRDHAKKLNKKMYRSAMQSILSELVRQERLVVVEDFSVAAPRTREVAAKLEALELTTVLVVVEEVDTNLYLGARNIRHVDVVDVRGVNPVNLIGFDKVLFTVGALRETADIFE